MKRKDQSPAWWQLYLTFPLLIALFILEGRLKISNAEHEVSQIGIVLFICWLIHLWLMANERALSRMDRLEQRTTFRMVPPVNSLPREDDKPLFQYPDMEIKGLLSNTFEMNCTGGKQPPVDEESKKKRKGT